MAKNNLDEQFKTNKADKWIGLSGFAIVIACFMAVLIALTIKFITWLFGWN